jgi:UDP-N-acetylglucosamine acyltransferase
VVVGPFAVLLGPLLIGDDVWIGPGVHLGGPPEIASSRHNVAWEGDLDHQEIRVGDRTRIRDGVTVHHGSVRPTLIGADCHLFSRVYVAHDVQISDAVTLTAGSSIGGHVTIRTRANIGLNVSVHQRRVVSAFAMVGMGTTVTRDVPPFTTSYGVPPRVHGLNAFGLRRAGYGDEVIEALSAAYAAGYPDPSGDGLPQDLRAELTWWADVPERRPMERAESTVEVLR